MHESANTANPGKLGQALRKANVKKNIYGCFGTTHGEGTFFTIRSYLATMPEQHANVLDCSLASSNASLRSLGWLSELNNTLFSLIKLASDPINTGAIGYLINFKKP